MKSAGGPKPLASKAQIPNKHTSRFLLAADGASSGVRKQLGAAYTGTSAASRWYIVDAVSVSPEAEALLLQRWPDFNFCCGSDTVFVHARTPSSPAHHRWEFLLQPDDTAPSSQALLPRIGVNTALVRVVREVQYSFHSRIASDWMFHHCIALVGDAAHCMPPFRAQGLASGLHDASNICWKIASVLQGHAHAELFDSYQRERQPHAQAAITAAERMGSIICFRRPKLLWHLKNRAFKLANKFGLFELLYRHFTPSTSISWGLISCSTAAAVGSPVPNVSISPAGADPQIFFDEQFWEARDGKLSWCLVLVDDGWDQGVSAQTRRLNLVKLLIWSAVVKPVCCDSSSAMGRWLLNFKCRAALVR